LHKNKEAVSKSQKTREPSHPEFISGSDIQYVGILKQVQDDGIYEFLDGPFSKSGKS